MPSGLKRYQHTGDFHFITSSCYRRQPLLATPRSKHIFEQTLERTRRWYGLFVAGYVVMPEHVHLLLSEPQRSNLAVALQMLKQVSARQLLPKGVPSLSPLSGDRVGARSPAPFWQARYYDFNVHSEKKRVEKLRYIHRNPVRRGLVQNPQDWPWSSFRHYATGVEGVVEIESEWTARKRERMGASLRATIRGRGPTLSPKAATRMGHPQEYAVDPDE